MLLLTLIVFSLTTVYSTSRISAPDFQAVNFAKAKEMRKLNGSVIKQVDVMSENECSLQCISDERCLSYNFGNKRNKSGTFVCELSDSDRFLGFGNFTEDVNFTYRGMQVTIAVMADAALSLIYYYYQYYYYYHYVRVCHPNADSYRELSPKQIFQLHENEKKRQYSRRVLWSKGHSHH